MTKFLSLLILVLCVSCHCKKTILRDHVSIEISVYEDGGEKKASAMPVLKPDSELNKYRWRFEYLLMNVSKMHQPTGAKERSEIWNFYPDTLKLKQLYLDKFIEDSSLVKYFEETYAPIANPNLKVTKTFNQEELMEVASKFFYCDQVRPDTTVQMHICVGLNGIKEAMWEKDYTLLAAFCFEAIFNDLDKDDSQLSVSYSLEHEKAVNENRNNITTLEKYLEDVRKDLFSAMKRNSTLKEKLLSYYKLNKNNLAFKIIN